MGMMRMSLDRNRDSDGDRDRSVASPYLPRPPPASSAFVSPQPRPARASSAPRPRSALYTGHSKFQEGSMSDRVSSAPPLDIIGAEKEYKYELSISPYRGRAPALDGRNGSPTSRRPFSAHEFPSVTLIKSKVGSTKGSIKGSIGGRSSNTSSSSSSSSSSGKSFFARPWLDSLRSILTGGGGGGSKNAAHDKAPASHDAKKEKEYMPSTQGTAVPSVRPSREEVLKGYRELMESDFFASRAIASTRRPPPARVVASASSSTSREASSYSSSLRPSISAPLPNSFVSNPVSAASLAAALDSSGSAPSPTAGFRGSVCSESRIFGGSAAAARSALPPRQSMDSAAPVKMASNTLIDGARSRGTKRASAEIYSLPEEVGGGDTGSVAKRLKKSASKLSLEIALPSSLRRSTQPVSADSSPRKSSKLTKLFPLGNSPLPLETTPRPRSEPEPDPDPALSVSRSSSLHYRSSVNGASGGSAPCPPLALSARAFHDGSSSARPRTGHGSVAGSPRKKRVRNPDHRVKEIPPSAAARAWHGAEPLCVVPDTNRGIPTVPEIPESYRQELWAGTRGNENAGIRF